MPMLQETSDVAGDVASSACQCLKDPLREPARAARLLSFGMMMANSSPPSRASIWPGRNSEETAAGECLQQRVSRRVTVDVVDVLEAIDVEAEQGDLLVLGVRHLDLLIESLVEVAAIGEAGQRIVMSQEPDFLLGELARPQVADRDRIAHTTREIDRLQYQFDGPRGPVRMLQTRFDEADPLRPTA